jgi:hypothetical protein
MTSAGFRSDPPSVYDRVGRIDLDANGIFSIEPRMFPHTVPAAALRPDRHGTRP